MLKNIETHEKVIIQKTVQLPIDVAAEVLACYCTSSTTQCVLCDVGNGVEVCPFTGTHCTDITADMWKEYLNE